MKQSLQRAFLLGGFFTSSIYAAIQDWMGKARYIAWLEATWLDWSPWVGVIGAVGSMLGYLWLCYEEAKSTP